MLALLGILCIAVLGTAFIQSSDDEEEKTLAEGGEGTGEDSEELQTADVGLFFDGQEGELADQQDTLVWTDGDDYIRAGANDIMFGGSGADTFEMPTVGPAYLQDYEDEDTIVIPYTGAEPEIEFAAMDHGTMILADGVPIVEVRGVFDFEDSITLVPRDQNAP